MLVLNPILTFHELVVLYPPFLAVILEIIDPHNPYLRDAAEKLVGLAHYTESHGKNFGRIESIIMEEDDRRRLNLQDEEIRERSKRVRTRAEVQRLFDERAVSMSN